MSRHHASMGSRRWEATRRAVFNRDNWRCQTPGCGRAGWPLEAHHVVSLDDGGDRWELANLITLCRTHHIETHRDRTVHEDAEVAAWAAYVREIAADGRELESPS